jgi:hypothetical protein
VKRIVRNAVTAGLLVAFVLALFGCGRSISAPGTAHGTRQSVPALGTPSATGTSVAPTTPTGTPGVGAVPQACPGGLGSITDAGTPQLVLGGARDPTTGAVRTGELVQVQLTSTNRWSFDNGAAEAGLLAPAGYEDSYHNVCVWNFRPQVATTLLLTFTGTALCTGKGACPQYAYRETFSVQVG